MTLIKALNGFKKEFPNLYVLALSIIEDGSKPISSGVYNSIYTDSDTSTIYCNGYFQVNNNNEITAIGEERFREGGWFWFAPK